MLRFRMRYHVIRRGRAKTLWADSPASAVSMAGFSRGKVQVAPMVVGEPVFRGGKLGSFSPRMIYYEFRDGQPYHCMEAESGLHDIQFDLKFGEKICSHCGLVEDG